MVVGVIITPVCAGPFPRCHHTEWSQQDGSCLVASNGTLQAGYLCALKSAPVYFTMPGCHSHGWGKDVLPIQL